MQLAFAFDGGRQLAEGDFHRRPAARRADDLAEPRFNRYFFAVLPDAASAAQIDALALALRRSHDLAGQPLGLRRYHVSLAGTGWPGEAPAGHVEALKAVGRALRAPVFDVGFDRLARFAHNAARPALVLAPTESLVALCRLQAAIGAGLRSLGFVGPSRFNPHLTLLYDEKPVAEARVALVRWRVREVVLIRSVHGEGRHRHLARWPFGGGSPAAPA